MLPRHAFLLIATATLAGCYAQHPYQQGMPISGNAGLYKPGTVLAAGSPEAKILDNGINRHQEETYSYDTTDALHQKNSEAINQDREIKIPQTIKHVSPYVETAVERGRGRWYANNCLTRNNITKEEVIRKIKNFSLIQRKFKESYVFIMDTEEQKVINMPFDLFVICTSANKGTEAADIKIPSFSPIYKDSVVINRRARGGHWYGYGFREYNGEMVFNSVHTHEGVMPISSSRHQETNDLMPEIVKRY